MTERRVCRLNKFFSSFRLFSLIFAWLATAPVPALAQGDGASDIARYSLANGLEVVVIPDHRTPVVVHMVWYKVGAVDEPWGKSGIAHFLEHLMFRGTEKVPPGQFSKIVALNGGRDNAFTASDYTGYFQMVAKDRLPLVMELEADRMVNLQLTDEIVEPELKVVIEERLSRVDNDPGSLLGERMRAVQYLHHPYREPLIGWLHELRQLDRQDAEDFYERFYTPSNAILIVAGDVTGPEVRALAEEHYGNIPARPVAAGFQGEEPPQLAARRVRMVREDVTQPTWRRSYLAPSAMAGETELAAPLEVLAQYLGGGSLSRLYQGLVVEKKIAAAAGAWYSAVQRGMTTFEFYAVPVPGVDMAVVEDAVDQEIAAIAAGAVDEASLERAKTLLKASTIYARDSVMAMARIYGSVLAVGLPARYVSDWADTVDAVTPEDLVRAVEAVLRPEVSVTGQLLPVAAGSSDAVIDGSEEGVSP